MRIKVALLTLVFTVLATADEGMWLFDHFPKDRVAANHGFNIGDEFLHHLERASVRFNNGGSGSFISAQGLLFTNHHVGQDCIQKLSTAEHDYMANGFQSASEDGEKVCPDLEVDALLGTSDVTAKVNEGITASTAPAEANKVRKAAIARIEKDCVESTKNRCDVVTLYSGGEYSLYQYKKYTDVRLVFAPEYKIAQFGGDPDNFTYPRYCLDFSLFRAYENGKPASTPDYLAWSKEGAKDGELTFVSGNPGSTGRLQTVAQMEFARDYSLPLILAMLKDRIQGLLAFGEKNAENKRIAQDYLDEDRNSFKAITGFEAGLKDAALMERKRQDEQKLRAAIAANPEKEKQFGAVWDQLAAAYKDYATIFKPYYMLEAAPNDSRLFVTARRVIRYAVETRKPNDQRLAAYQDAGLPSLEREMYSPDPIYPGLEELMLATQFRFMARELGADDPTVKAVLGGKTPEEAAHLYVSTSKLSDVAERKTLAKSPDAVKKSKDGMIRLALILDGPARKLRAQYEDKVEAVITASASKLAQARFAVYGTSEYPDATFTLRLSYGPVKGYTNAAGKPVAWDTTFAGLYQRATGKEPFDLPPSWVKSKADLDLNTPFDFVTTNDTHGGNSGSPTVNEKGEIVGILFDGNLEGLANRYVYTEEQARSVHVASQAIVEALRKVYHADRVLRELGFE